MPDNEQPTEQQLRAQRMTENAALKAALEQKLSALRTETRAPHLPSSLPIPPPRRIYDHIDHLAYEHLVIEALGGRGPGGECAHYRVSNPGKPLARSIELVFQSGPVEEYGINGLTNEALLAIVIDRLRCFQTGPFYCRENREALDHCEAALQWLHIRTRERRARGVEGRNE